MLVGVLAARRGLLDRPAEHLPLLRRLAVGGVGAGVLGGLPAALAVAGVVDVEPGAAYAAMETVHDATGVLAGIGYVAALAHWSTRREGVAPARVRRALTATGSRSLTCYLLQSVLFAPLLAAWGLGLGDGLHGARAAAVAVLVWAATVGIAYALDRAGRPGPAEAALRRLVYGRRAG
nr:DUF418 domain-containing protein [Motilibacter aurantiacus]